MIFEEKISIIIPIYNAEQHLEQCIRSVVNQSYNNLEIILVNDGSTDSSLKICNKWKLKDNRIIVVNKKNGGPADSRNKGLEMASGEYIGFVDSDDYIEPKMYEQMKKDMDNYCVDVVMCNSLSVFEDGKTKEGYSGYDSFKVNSKELIKRFFNFEKIFYSSVWSKLYKKSMIKNYRFSNDIGLGEDYYFNGLVYKNIDSFYYNKEMFYNYRIRSESISRNRIDGHFFDKYIVAQALAKEYKKTKYLSKNDISHITFATSYEILYELYETNSSSELKKKWKKVYIEEYNNYIETRIKSRIQMACMRYIPSVYVKVTRIKRNRI